MLKPRDIHVLTHGWEGDGTSNLPPLELEAWCALVDAGPDDPADVREYFAQVRRVDHETHPIIAHVVDFAHAQHDHFFAGDFSLDAAAFDMLRLAAQDYSERYARVSVAKADLLAALAGNARTVTLDVGASVHVDDKIIVTRTRDRRRSAESWTVKVSRGKLRAIVRRVPDDRICLDYRHEKLLVDAVTTLEVINDRKNSRSAGARGRGRVRSRSATQAK